MEQNYWMDALVQAKRLGNLLNEVLDVTQQMGEAVDRNDQVSVQLLISMRQEPIGKLETTDQILRDLAESIPDPSESARLFAVLRGEAALSEREKALAGQVASNMRRRKQVLELDKRLNQKLAREKSIYHKNTS